LIEKKRRSVLTSPAALLMVETEDGIERIAPDENGRASIPKRHRSLIAVDALGRIAAAPSSQRARRGKRVVAKEDDSIPLSIPMGGSLGHAEIAKPEASLPQLLEEKQSSLEQEMGELDEETKEAIRDF
jgi:hypothetical protein